MRAIIRLFFVAAALIASVLPAFEAPAQDISFARPDLGNPISVSATNVTRWRSGNYEVLHLAGNVEIGQQNFSASAVEGIVWVEIPDAFASDSSSTASYKVIAYIEDRENSVVVNIGRDGPVNPNTGSTSDRIVDQQWFGRLFTRNTVDVQVAVQDLADRAKPEIFSRATAAMAAGGCSSVAQAQYTEPGSPQILVSPQTGQITTVAPTAPVPAYGAQGGSQPHDPFSGPGTGQTVVQNVAAPMQQPGFQQPGPPFSTAPVQNQNTQNPNGRTRQRTQIDFSARDAAVDLNATYQTNPNNPNERVFVGTGGVRVLVTSPDLQQMEQFRRDNQREVVILADNVVAWQSEYPDGTSRAEIYLDGNVIFAKGSRVIYAEQMYYDADNQSGTILDAEILTPAQQYDGLIRLKADVIQQVDENNLQAYGAAFTTSRIGVPRYWLQTDGLGLNRREVPAFDPDTGQPLFDRQTGLQQTEDEYRVEANQNQVYVAGVPVFSWPRFRSSLSDPSLYLNRFKIGNDSIFGTQILTGFNMFQVLGVRNPPRGTGWTGIVDYLSERGLAFGSDVDYRRNSFLGRPGLVNGRYKSWFINDNGLDNLGRGRFGIPPEKDFRGRILLNHKHQFGPGYSLRAELGYISDRNFLEQFYEREWDTYKDQTTGFWLERNIGTQSFNLTADVRVNDFFTQTNWLPRFDHFVIGQPLAQDRFVYHAHSHIGYAQLKTADAPLDATQALKFDPLAWEADVEGVRAGTRHEIDLPMQVGPVKVVPYLLGDATFWGEDRTGSSLFRGYGQTGIKASLPFWRVDPTIQSTLWNLNGLAHKVTVDMEASYADASQDIGDLPLYDQLDDDSQEDFRRRFAFDTFGIMAGMDTPLKYDERLFALRSGMQGNVTAPSAEIADDLALFKFGVRQRWQTKRGLPGQERIIDWITLDAETVLFPKEERDNFGSSWGLFDYDFRWHVGDRVSLVSDGYFDFFGQGLRTASFGMHAGRPEVGNIYLGYRMIEGPISSNVITAALTYRMSEKWGVRATSQFDFGETGSIGQGVNFIYIGESFLWQFGVNADFARDNVGFRIGFEPRFVRRSKLFNPGGVSVGPAGARYLE